MAKDAAEYALKSIGKQLSAGVAKITSIEIASLGVPVFGPMLGILANWIIGELGGFIKSGRCDGAVAFEQYVATGLDIYNETFHGTYSTSTTHLGKTSPDGCGPTSEYIVSWSIIRDK